MRRENLRFSGCGLYLLWFLLFVFFSAVVGAVFSHGTLREQGFPTWLLVGRIFVLAGLLASCLGLLAQKRWGVLGFFSFSTAMIPLSVAYSYFSLALAEDFQLTLGWVVRNALITAVVVMVMVSIVFIAIRPRDYAAG